MFPPFARFKSNLKLANTDTRATPHRLSSESHPNLPLAGNSKLVVIKVESPYTLTTMSESVWEYEKYDYVKPLGGWPVACASLVKELQRVCDASYKREN